MADNTGAGLARVVVAAPRRRLDLALPEQIPLAMLLPSVLPRAGESLADDGLEHGGWALRRTDGSSLDMARSLAAQGIRDGEVLHLSPRYEQWPEAEYDDVVDAIADGAKRYGQQWSPAASRITGLAAGLVILAGALVLALRSGPSWTLPGAALLVAAGLLLGTGVLVARVVPDATAGALIGAAAMGYAFTGGLLLLGGDDRLGRLGAPHLLVGSGALLIVGTLGYAGVAALVRLFAAGIVIGVLGALAGAIGLTPLGAAPVAALLVAVLALTAPALPLLSVRLGKVPLPVLPRTADDLLHQDPVPPALSTYAMVARADELLTGGLWGYAVLNVVCLVFVSRVAGLAGLLLTVVVAANCLLRSRVFTAVRHRVPWLIAGVFGLATLLPRVAADGSATRIAVVAALLVVAALTITAGLRYGRRPPSVYLGRIGDLLDVLLVLAIAPIACSVLGVYGYVRGLGG